MKLTSSSLSSPVMCSTPGIRLARLLACFARPDPRRPEATRGPRRRRWVDRAPPRAEAGDGPKTRDIGRHGPRNPQNGIHRRSVFPQQQAAMARSLVTHMPSPEGKLRCMLTSEMPAHAINLSSQPVPRNQIFQLPSLTPNPQTPNPNPQPPHPQPGTSSTPQPAAPTPPPTPNPTPSFIHGLAPGEVETLMEAQRLEALASGPRRQLRLRTAPAVGGRGGGGKTKNETRAPHTFSWHPHTRTLPPANSRKPPEGRSCKWN